MFRSFDQKAGDISRSGTFGVVDLPRRISGEGKRREIRTPNGKQGKRMVLQSLYLGAKRGASLGSYAHRGGLPAITKSISLGGQICNVIYTLRVIVSYHVARAHVVFRVYAGMSCRRTIFNGE